MVKSNLPCCNPLLDQFLLQLLLDQSNNPSDGFPIRRAQIGLFVLRVNGDQQHDLIFRKISIADSKPVPFPLGAWPTKSNFAETSGVGNDRRSIRPIHNQNLQGSKIIVVQPETVPLAVKWGEMNESEHL
jgi:hypothetical protein